MILFLRKNFHKGFIQALVLVMVLSMIGIGSLSQIISLFFSDSQILFSVNGLGITKTQFGLRTSIEKNILNYYATQLGDIAPRFLAQAGISMSPEKNAYKKIVQELALTSCAERSGLGVDLKAVAQKVQDPMALMNIFGQTLPRSLYDRNGKIQQEILMKILHTLGLSLESFELLLEQSVEQEAALQVLSLAVPVTHKEIDVHILKKYGTRHFTVQFYSLSDYLKKAEANPVDDETLRAFFEAQNNLSHRYWTQEKKKGSEVVPAGERPYKEVAKMVKHDFYTAEAQKLALDDLNSVGLADSLKTTLKKFSITAQNSEAELKKLSAESLSADRINNMVIEGTSLRGLLEKQAYIVTLDKVEKPEKITLEQQLLAQKELFKENERFVTAASVDSLVKNAKIKSNSTLESSQVDLD